MKTTTEHFKIGSEVFVIEEYEQGTIGPYYGLTRETIIEVVITKDLKTKKDEVVYWFENWDTDRKYVFATQEEALEVLKYKLIEQCKQTKK